MKRKLYFLLVLFACCLLSITQAQTNCDVYISPNSSSNCLLEDYLERYLPLLESGTGEDCVLACKGNVVRYDAVCNAGQQYVWEISGASSYEFTNQNRSVIVTWGMGDIGNISVTVHTSDTTISTSEMCVFLIESPQVGFSSTPTYYINSSGDKIIEICLGESVEFTDMSSAGTTPITGYLWEHDFGVSSSQNYTLTPTQEGEFKVIHCVYNECGCEDCETIILRVLPAVDLELSCYGTVCENTTAIYLVSNPDCSEYRWNVEGGSFEGQGERKIVVHWGSPASGFGTISLDAYPCETECKSLLSLQIPIIINNAKIEGPEVICVGDIVQYELPMWGSTWYQWTVTPQDSNEVVRHEAEYQNQHLLEFTQPGEYVVQTEYGCDFLDCGPHFTQKIIIVKDTMSINSIDSVLCIGDTGDYTTWHGDSVIWRVYRQNGQQIHSSVAPTLSYLFSNPGTYKVTASGVDYCKTAEYAVTILENPPALTTTQGPNVACLNGSILLSGTPTHPNYYLEWEPQCALVSPSSVSGDEVTITYSGEVCDVAVYQVHNEYGCRSQAYIHEVDTFVLAPHGLPAVTHTCAGSTVNIEIPNQAPNVLYEWKLFPPNAASIQGDHLQPEIDVLTNHLYNFVSPTIVSMQLTRKFCAQKVIEIVRLSIEDEETPTLEFPDTVCTNEIVTEFDEQPHIGSERIAIECVPAIKLTYNCNGYVVITDISKYKNGYTIPERSYTIPGVGSVSMLYPTMVDSINVGIPTDTITYVVNMSMDSSECTYSQSITLTPHPTITDIEFSPKMCINTPFQFTANTTGDIRNYKWDFGDNSYNYGNNIFHTYHIDLTESSLVQLTITDRWGCSATDTVYVEVGGTKPNGNLGKLGNDVCMGEARVIQYQQPFAVAPILAHYYWRPNETVTTNGRCTVYKTGNYIVLVVTDNYGCKVEDMINVGFLNPPTAR